MLFHKFDSINDFDKLIIEKRKEFSHLLSESIIKDITVKYNMNQ